MFHRDPEKKIMKSIISVIVCSHNRAESLRQCLKSLTEMTLPSLVSWELILVLNGCRDHSVEVAKEFELSLPLHLHELPIPGLSKARNHAIKRVKGKLILFTDDDVEVDKNWLMGYWQAFQTFPEASYFGGPIFSQISSGLELSTSAFSDSLFDGLLMRKDLGTESRFFKKTEAPFGANMAFQAEVFNSIQFREDLGRKRHWLLSGEESALINSCQEKGFKGVWVSQALVTHFISPKRLQIPFLIAYFVGLGISQARYQNHSRPHLSLRKYKGNSLHYALASIVLFLSYFFERTRLFVANCFKSK